MLKTVLGLFLGCWASQTGLATRSSPPPCLAGFPIIPVKERLGDPYPAYIYFHTLKIQPRLGRLYSVAMQYTTELLYSCLFLPRSPSRLRVSIPFTLPLPLRMHILILID